MATLIDSAALDRFFGYQSNFIMAFTLDLKRYFIGDFLYFDSDEIESRLKPKAKKTFKEFRDRNTLRFVEYDIDKDNGKGRD